MASETWSTYPTPGAANFQSTFKNALDTNLTASQNLDTRLDLAEGLTGSPDYIWADEAARLAQVGMITAQIGFQLDTLATYRYSGSSWVFLLAQVGASSSQTFTNKTIDANNNTISNLSHGAEVDNPAVAHGVGSAIVGVSDTQTLTNKIISGSNNTIVALVHGVNTDNPSSGVHGVTGTVVGTTDTQTLTSKTIDADLNTISNLAHGAEVDNPSSGVHGVAGSIVGTSDSQTLTSKTIDADLNTISNLAHGSEVDNPSSGVHGVTGSIVGTSDSQTLTNKTIISPTWNAASLLGVPSYKNLVVKNNATNPTYQLDISADSLTLVDEANFKTYRATSVSVTADITAAGDSNGLDTGTEASSTWYYIFIISNGTLVKGLISLSSTAPTMPSGYTYKKLVSAIYNNSSSDFSSIDQTGAVVHKVRENAYLSQTDTTPTQKDMSAFRPAYNPCCGLIFTLRAGTISGNSSVSFGVASTDNVTVALPLDLTAANLSYYISFHCNLDPYFSKSGSISSYDIISNGYILDL